MEDDVLFGRVFKSTQPDKCRDVLRMFSPMLKNVKMVGRIFNEVQLVHSDDDEATRRLIFIAAVYQSYCPISYLKVKDGERVAGKLPAGVRDEMARCLGFSNSEMCNHYREFTRPQMNPFNNGPERPFKIKVQEVVNKFKQFSINSWDTQIEMFAS